MIPSAYHEAVVAEIGKLVRQCTCFALLGRSHEPWCLYVRQDEILKVLRARE